MPVAQEWLDMLHYDKCYDSIVTDGKMEASRKEVTCPVSLSQEVGELGFEPGQPDSIPKSRNLGEKNLPLSQRAPPFAATSPPLPSTLSVCLNYVSGLGITATGDRRTLIHLGKSS